MSFKDKKLDESDIAEKIAKEIGSEHQKILFDEENLPILINKAMRNLDIPLGDSSYVPTFLLSELVSKSHRCVLSGDGGDELFGGYPTYRAHQILTRYEELVPQYLRGHVLKSALKFLPKNLDNINTRSKVERFLAGRNLSLTTRHLIWMSTSFNIQIIDKLTGEDNLIDVPMFSDLEKLLFNSGITAQVNAAQFIDLNYYLPGSIHAKTDNASMSNSLEVRSPFVNKKMLEVSSSIPKIFKVNSFQTKIILRDIARKFLPINIHKLPKRGFNFSVGNAIKNHLEDEMRSSILNFSSFIDSNYALKILDDHIKGTNNNRKIIWTIYALSNWWQNIKSAQYDDFVQKDYKFIDITD